MDIDWERTAPVGIGRPDKQIILAGSEIRRRSGRTREIEGERCRAGAETADALQSGQ